MMAVYSHVRRKALDEAAKALEPDAVALPPAPEPVAENAIEDSGVMPHVTSQPASSRRNVIELPKKIGSSGWTRTDQRNRNVAAIAPANCATTYPGHHRSVKARANVTAGLAKRLMR